MHTKILADDQKKRKTHRKDSKSI